MLRPVLELARRQNATYRWGYPLSVMFRRDQRSFTLKSPSDLPGLFTFLAADPIRISNWLMFLPQASNRPGPQPSQRHLQPRPQRQRRRSRAPTPEGSREL